MSLTRTCAVVALAFGFAGCGYVHFGRLPPARAGDAALQQAYADLSLEHKILKQELQLSRKETDTLRTALERTGNDASGPSSIAQQLAETSRELANLRDAHAKLRSERGTAAPAAQTISAGDAALRDENTRLKAELERARQDNAELADKLKSSLAANEHALATVDQLNTDLIAQKQARERAEQVTNALRSQLAAVMARAGRAESTAAPAEPPPASSSSTSLSALKSPPSEAAPSAELRTSLSRIQSMAGSSSVKVEDGPVRSPTAPPTVAPSATAAPSYPAVAAQSSTRRYTVQNGDTLEKLAIRFFGTADQWIKIYTANAEVLSSSQGLKPGTELQIPEK